METKKLDREKTLAKIKLELARKRAEVNEAEFKREYEEKGAEWLEEVCDFLEISPIYEN